MLPSHHHHDRKIYGKQAVLQAKDLSIVRCGNWGSATGGNGTDHRTSEWEKWTFKLRSSYSNPMQEGWVPSLSSFTAFWPLPSYSLPSETIIPLPHLIHSASSLCSEKFSKITQWLCFRKYKIISVCFTFSLCEPTLKWSYHLKTKGMLSKNYVLNDNLTTQEFPITNQCPFLPCNKTIRNSHG
jgi:hypothetical protein